MKQVEENTQKAKRQFAHPSNHDRNKLQPVHFIWKTAATNFRTDHVLTAGGLIFKDFTP